MYEQLITQIDGFFANPLELRNHALSITYNTPMSQINPTVRGPIAEQTPCNPTIRKATLNKLAPIVKGEISSVITEFRYVHKKTIKRAICHADNMDLAGVVYLTLPEHCQGGTVFFRHKLTGDYWLHPERRHLYNFDEKEDWEETYRADMAFNRLVFYPGLLFHAIGTPYFGDTIQNARLTLNLFLNIQDKSRIARQFQQLETSYSGTRQMGITSNIANEQIGLTE